MKYYYTELKKKILCKHESTYPPVEAKKLVEVEVPVEKIVQVRIDDKEEYEEEIRNLKLVFTQLKKAYYCEQESYE